MLGSTVPPWSVQVFLLGTRGCLLGPRLGIDGQRRGFTPRSPVVERVRNVIDVGQFRQETQREIEILRTVHLASEASMPADEFGAKDGEVTQSTSG